MDWLRKYVFHNFALKLLALASAVVLWQAVAREPVSELAFTVPIEFQHVPGDYVIAASSAPEAQVWIRGPRRVVRSVGAAELHVTVDLAPVHNLPGDHTVDLLPAQIKAPGGVEVVQVVPARLRFRLDARMPAPGAVK